MKARCLIREDFSSLGIAHCFLPPHIPSPSVCLSPLLSLHSGKPGPIPPVLRSQLTSNFDVEGIVLEANLTAAVPFFLASVCGAGGLGDEAAVER